MPTITESRYRVLVIALLAAIFLVETARGVAETQRVVIVSGDVTVDGTVSAEVTNPVDEVKITNTIVDPIPVHDYSPARR